MTSDTYKKEQGHVLFRLTGVGLAFYVIPLPAVAFIICVILSVIFNLEQSTATHCRVRNYLPSISAAIGGFTPQRYIWRICIALHVAPRFLVAVVYYNHFRAFHVKSYPSLYYFLAGLSSWLHVFENMALVTLSYVSSTENYAIHEGSFIAFMIFSQVYMVLSMIVFWWSRAGSPWSQKDRRSMRYKLTWFSINMGSFLAAIYFFWRHNRYCEPGVYTLFALAEYGTVLSNITYHAAGAIDFGEGHLLFVDAPRSKDKQK